MAEDHIVIRNLLLRGFIGFQDWEREKKQDILINLMLYTDMRRAAQSDDVADALDYKTITKKIIAYVEDDATRHDLVESLAGAAWRAARSASRCASRSRARCALPSRWAWRSRAAAPTSDCSTACARPHPRIHHPRIEPRP